jgi:hypothetical protein
LLDIALNTYSNLFCTILVAVVTLWCGAIRGSVM